MNRSFIYSLTSVDYVSSLSVGLSHPGRFLLAQDLLQFLRLHLRLHLLPAASFQENRQYVGQVLYHLKFPVRKTYREDQIQNTRVLLGSFLFLSDSVLLGLNNKFTSIWSNYSKGGQLTVPGLCLRIFTAADMLFLSKTFTKRWKVRLSFFFMTETNSRTLPDVISSFF